MKNPIPLSKRTLDNTISLIEEVFKYREDQELACKNLIESLSQTNFNKNYWVAIDRDNNAIGIIGLYIDPQIENSKTTVWLGWFGVHPERRRRGMGSSLLEFTLNEAKKRGFKTIKLYTSLDKNEEAAHKLYEKYGFKKVNFNGDTEVIYYKKDLTEKGTNPEKGGKHLHEIKIEWEGPFSAKEVIEGMDDEGNPPDYDGEDYGLYQIYGKHILCGSDTLLYIGKATKQTFSRRFNDHKKWWLDDEEDIQVYLGRIYNPKRHSEKDNWKSWETDVSLSENILIYKYSPNYNNTGIGDKPSLSPFRKAMLIHKGKRHKLEKEDNAPEDYS